jgi:UDP-N-acetylglucosamine transferase subunit ALG13
MVRWVDTWLASGPQERVRCLVQFGTSERPRLAEGKDYLPYGEMETAMAQALAVVCHGGPGSVMMARWLGKKPIVVPRRHGLGEHIDDHQRVFASRMAREGELELVEEEARFGELLDGALAGSVSLELSAARAEMDESLARFERLVAGLVAPR